MQRPSPEEIQVYWELDEIKKKHVLQKLHV